MKHFHFSGTGQELKIDHLDLVDGQLLGEVKGVKFFKSALAKTPYDSLSLNSADSYILCQFFKELWDLFDISKSIPMELPAELSPSNSRDEVTIFSGSFHPWHQGHKSCLDLCPGSNLILIPDSNPQKGGIERDHFSQLLQLAVDSKCPVYPGFIGGPPNPTSEWFPKLKAKRINFLLGMDSFLGLKSWINPEKFISHVHTFYVVPRQTSEINFEEVLSWVKGISSSEVEVLPHHKFEELSSTQFRSES